MKFAAWILGASWLRRSPFVLAVMFACAAVPAAQAKDQPVDRDAADAEMKWEARFGEMTDVCKLTDEQKAKILTIDQAREKALVQFCSEHQTELNSLATRMMNPRLPAAEMERLSQEYDKVMAPARQLEQQHREQMRALLTVPQRAAWQEYCVLKAIYMQFLRARLTDQQKEQAKALYAKMPKAAGDADEQLVKNLSAELMAVLRPEQRDVMLDPNKVIPRSTPASNPAK